GCVPRTRCCSRQLVMLFFFFFQAEDGIRDRNVTGVQTCALPISRAAPDGRDRACRRSRSVPLPCPSPPLLVAQPVATVVVKGDLDGLTPLLVQLTTSLTPPGHEPLLACVALSLDPLAPGVRRARVALRGHEPRPQPQAPLLVVNDVCPEAEDVAALRLAAVVAGGSLKVAERALGVGPVAMIAALGAPQAEHLPAPGILGPRTQLDVEH